MANEKPVKKFKMGGIYIDVWENSVVGRDGHQDILRTVTLERRYKDQRGEWKTSGSLRVGDLPKVILGLTKAYELSVFEDKSSNGGDAQ